MTPKQQLREAKFVFVHLATANGANVCLTVAKSEIERFMREDGADPTDSELWTWSFTPKGSLHITFAT